MILGEILARNAGMYRAERALIERGPAKNKRREMTWKEFDDLANRVANALIMGHSISFLSRKILNL